MNTKTLNLLEFPKVLQNLAAHVSYSPTKELIAGLSPSSDIDEVRLRLAYTSEARRLLEMKGSFSLRGARDIRTAVQRATLGGALESSDLLDVQSTLASVRAIRATLVKFANELPLLAAIGDRLSDCSQLEKEINRCLGPRGEVVDEASETLQRIRTAVRVAHERLLNKLNEIVSSATYRPALQEAIITQREGRYVVPVKSDFRGQLRGVVHDRSASGATLYVEPLAVVDLNNRWRELLLDEDKEVRRILKDLSTGVAAVAPELRENVAALADLDLALAKALYAGEILAEEPAVVDRAALASEGKREAKSWVDLKRARHPLLSGDVVPIDIWLGPDFSVLVITGPNTGGKTVALKTVGLLTAMAQAGLHIPADEGSRVRVFGGIFADIGDEQSIEQSLSTFSSHMTNIVGILRQADDESLVLLDELGAGTDPAEGSALARAILANLLDRGSSVIATTHYSELKAYAHLTPGLQNASVEFDVETLSPTYKLSIGLPGRSNALAIATRLGLPREITRAAREVMDPRKVEVEALLGRIREERRAARAAREEADVALDDARKLQQRLSAAWAGIEDERRQALAAAREEAQLEVEKVRQHLSQAIALANAASASREQLDEAAREVRNAQQQATSLPRYEEPVREPESVAEEEVPSGMAVGGTVWIDHLQQAGELLSLPNARGEVEVQLGALKTRVSASEVRPTRSPYQPSQAQAGVSIPAAISEREAPPLEVDLRGMRAEEALEVLDKYVHDAYLGGLPFVRVIHGKGTGVLRQVVRDYLRNHALVRSLQTAEQREGGEGATVARLAS
ncbi:MAG: endonuclease MutS2 [Dehalococcoidales bacterium]|nr:endonuclease MutS2 [Dehalococcoidales bacterium]